MMRDPGDWVQASSTAPATSSALQQRQLMRAGSVQVNMDTSPLNLTKSPVVSVPNQTAWVLILFFGAFSAATFCGSYAALHPGAAQQRDPRAAALFFFMGLLFAVPTVIGVYWTCRARIEATKDGLRWRGMGVWKFAAWSEVSDYYLQQGQKGQISRIVETTSGKIYISPFYAEVESMAQVITGHAVNAPAHEWAPQGCRPVDMEPHQFFYSRWELRGTLALSIILGATAFAIMVIKPIVKLSANAHTIGVPLATAIFVMGCLVTAWPLSILGIWISTAWSSLKNSDQRIETSAAGIVCTERHRRIEATWEEISRFGVPHDSIKFTLGGQFFVYTSHGDFSFSQFLRNDTLLRQIIRNWAPGDADEQKKAFQADVLPSPPSRWAMPNSGEAEFVYHYRTRTNRAMMWLAAAFALMPLAVILISKSFGVPPTIAGGGETAAYAIPAPFILWIFWRYHAAHIVTDKEGILERSSGGARRLAWAEVKSVTKGEFVTVVHGDRANVRFWNTIAFHRELQDEIKRRSLSK